MLWIKPALQENITAFNWVREERFINWLRGYAHPNEEENMTHWRSCTKQKMLLIYSPQADYIKHTLCSTYFGMKRDTGCSSATSQGRRCCEPPGISSIWVTYGEEGDKEQKKRLFSVKSSNTAPSSSRHLFFVFSPSLACALYGISHSAVPATLPGLPPPRLQLVPSPYIGSNTSPEQVN